MRTRRVMAAVCGVLVLLLSGCGGNEAGPTASGPTRDEGPDALPLKLKALTADQCFLAPAQQPPKTCEKYVTELGNTAAQVRKRAGTKDQPLANLADQLDLGVNSFRSHTCITVTTPGNGPCTQAISDIATALQAIKTRVNGQATPG